MIECQNYCFEDNDCKVTSECGLRIGQLFDYNGDACRAFGEANIMENEFMSFEVMELYTDCLKENKPYFEDDETGAAVLDCVILCAEVDEGGMN